MPIRRPLSFLLLPLLCLLSLPVQSFVGGIAVSIGRATNVAGADVPPFSADAQLETEEHQLTSRVYYKPGMVRDVTTMSGMEMVTIQRYDLGKVWILMGQGMYMESAIDQAEQAPQYTLVERTLEGTEEVNGIQTSKYKTIYQGPEGRFGGFTWFTQDNIAVKGFMVSETNGEKHRLKWTLTNIERDEQPAALFELPPGAKPMSGMGGLMNMMGGMGNMAPAGAADPNSPADTSLQDSASSALKSVTKGLGNLFGK